MNPPHTLESLFAGFSEAPELATPVCGLTDDSRSVVAGMVYVAVRGTVADGHDFIDDACRRGAVALVVDRPGTSVDGIPVVLVKDTRVALSYLAAIFYGFPSRRLQVTGITGTNGKTTVACFLSQLLEACGSRSGMMGTVGVSFGGQWSASDRTTPGAVQVQRTFAEMERAECTHVVMEVSSHALDQQRISDVKFRTAVFTNLTRDHLDYHGSLDAYFEAKLRLFSFPSLAHRIVNLDAPRASELLERSKGYGDAFTYGFCSDANLRAEILNETLDGTEGVFESADVREHFFLPCPGRYNIENLLAAVSSLLVEGVPLSRITPLIPSLDSAPGRMERVSTPSGSIFVDYAHTPDAVSRAFSCLRPLTRGRLVGVFGCGGDRDRGKRALMREAAEEIADHLILTLDNPRTEDPEQIMTDLLDGKKIGGPLEVITDRRDAIGAGVAMLREGDALLIAGKGHETFQDIGGEHVPFDDREVAREAVWERWRKHA